MRSLVGVLVATSVCLSGEKSQAQPNYQLFAGAMHAYNAPVRYEASAIVLSFQDSRVYFCSAETLKKDNSIEIRCIKSSFNGKLMNGGEVTSQLNHGPVMKSDDLVWTGIGLWQLDQAGGIVQFCMTDPVIANISSSCASTIIGK